MFVFVKILFQPDVPVAAVNHPTTFITGFECCPVGVRRCFYFLGSLSAIMPLQESQEYLSITAAVVLKSWKV